MDPLWTDITGIGLELLTLLLAPAAALLGAFGAVRISNKHAAEREDSARLEDRKKDVRDIAVELVQSGYDWAADGLAYSVGQLSLNREGAPTYDPRGVEAAEKLGASRNRHLAAFSRFMLSVSEAEPLTAAANLREKMNGTVKITSPLLGASMLGQGITTEAFTAMFDHFDTYRADLDAFERVLQPFVAGVLSQTTKPESLAGWRKRIGSLTNS